MDRLTRDNLLNQCRLYVGDARGAFTHEEQLELARAFLDQSLSQESVRSEALVELHPATAILVRDFTIALAQKLLAAEKKYGYSDGWIADDWMDECRAKLREHVEKGDPRDVAAYCAFLWYHKESTALQSTARVAEGRPEWDGYIRFDSDCIINGKEVKAGTSWGPFEKSKDIHSTELRK